MKREVARLTPLGGALDDDRLIADHARATGELHRASLQSPIVKT